MAISYHRQRKENTRAKIVAMHTESCKQGTPLPVYHSGLSAGAERLTTPWGSWFTSLCLGAWALGIGLVVVLPVLPARSIIVAFAAIGLCVVVAGGWGRFQSGAVTRLVVITGIFALGLSWGMWNASKTLAAQLPEPLHGQDFSLRVKVSSLPEVRPASFRFDRHRSASPDHPEYDIRFTARVLAPAAPRLANRVLDLSWYGATQAQREQLRSGSVWDMTLRLKMPRGSVNPHTFDYEAWLLQRGIAATGYVRNSDVAPRRVASSRGLGRIRESLRDALAQGQDRQHAALMAALLLGDRSAVDQSTRTLLQETGTAHLLAISGLHVGMVAALGLLLGNLLARIVAVYRSVSPMLLPVLLGLCFAAFYTVIAGVPLSALRAMIMTAVLLLAWLWRRRIGPATGFSLALAAVLTLQPLAPLSAGFWLSFGAVAGLLLGYSGRSRGRDKSTVTHTGLKLFVRGLRWAGGLIQSQLLIFTCLLVPSALIFFGVSLSGLLVNLVAIPWVGLLVLPVLLLAGLMLVGGAKNADWLPVSLCLDYVDWQLRWLVTFLETCHRQAAGWQSLYISGHILAALAVVSAVLLILPRGFPGRWLGGVLPVVMVSGWVLREQPRLPIYPPDAPQEELRVTVLDVGQGLSVTARAGNQNLVFDTGADTPAGWSAGASIVAPFLRGEGVGTLDAVFLSHGDRDHAGGLAGLLNAMPVVRGVAPGALVQRYGYGDNLTVSTCTAGEQMTFESLTLDFLWPASEVVSGEENDHSCVVLLQWYGRRVLLTGDISRKVERRLSSMYPDLAPVDLLVAPHHGSKTSSSDALIQWARPATVAFSAGFKHHFGHPHPDVVARYRAAGSRIFNTADSGAVDLSWSSGDQWPEISCARSAPRFWYARGAKPDC